MYVHRKSKKQIDTTSNYYLRDKRLSLKAKGLMSLMLSLPEDWDYSVVGLVKILKDGKDSVRTTLNELIDTGYLKRERVRGKDGKLKDVEYFLQEEPRIIGFSSADSKNIGGI